MNHEVTIFDRCVYVSDRPEIIQNGVNADTLIIKPDNEWNDLDEILVIFSNKDKHIRLTITNFTDEITIPWEVLTENGKMYITVVGYKDQIVRVITKKMDQPFLVNVSGAGEDPSDPPLEPTKDQWHFLKDILENFDERIKELESSSGGSTWFADARHQIDSYISEPEFAFFEVIDESDHSN